MRLDVDLVDGTHRVPMRLDRMESNEFMKLRDHLGVGEHLFLFDFGSYRKFCEAEVCAMVAKDFGVKFCNDLRAMGSSLSFNDCYLCILKWYDEIQDILDSYGGGVDASYYNKNYHLDFEFGDCEDIMTMVDIMFGALVSDILSGVRYFLMGHLRCTGGVVGEEGVYLRFAKSRVLDRDTTNTFMPSKEFMRRHLLHYFDEPTVVDVKFTFFGHVIKAESSFMFDVGFSV
jgi:hypothetical protein